jgi:hypothetical protein
MNPMIVDGAYCVWPRESYNPADLPAEYHGAVWCYFERAALRDFLPEARNQTERAGMRERAQEAASMAYMVWRTTCTARIPRGAHASALAGVRKVMQLSGWRGRTGQRRAARRNVALLALERRERLRAQRIDTPLSVAMAVERIETGPALRRKAAKLAQRLGVDTRTLVREACGFSD